MHKKFRVGLGIISLLLIVTVLCILGFRYSKMQQEMERLDSATYDGIFCSMYDVSGYEEEDFLKYRGLKVIKYNGIFRGTKEVSQYIKRAYVNNVEMHTVYLGMDPWMIWEEANHCQETWQELLNNNLLYFTEEYPDTMFEILLPAPRLSVWTSLSREKLDEHVLVYQSFLNALDYKTNVKVFYVGDEEWLYRNKDNYVSKQGLNGDVAKHIFLSTYCDGNYGINGESFSEKIQTFKQMVINEQENPAYYPDLSQCRVVFLGDSIIGIDKGTTSIPGVVAALGRTTTYNVGQGGLTAAKVEGRYSFLSMVALLTGKETTKYDTEDTFSEEIEEFLQEPEDSQLVFVINFGLNDYFQGINPENEQDAYDIKTYGGALRTGIQQLKEYYPKAHIILVSPTYISLYEEGTMILGEEAAILEEYRQVAKQVSEDCDIYYKNACADMGIDAGNEGRYLSDRCHLNHQGRFLYGVQMVEYINKILE